MSGGIVRTFIYRMKSYMQIAFEGRYARTPCADEIRPMIEDFFNESIEIMDKLDGTDVCWHIERITEIAIYLANNTRNYEKLSIEDIISLAKIFCELEAFRDEALEIDSQSQEQENFSRKILCISEMIHKNMIGTHDSKVDHENWRDGMIFQRYENLWEVIHRVNTEWEELVSRGYSIQVFYDYWKSFMYDRKVGREGNEESKLANFMALLDEKMV